MWEGAYVDVVQSTGVQQKKQKKTHTALKGNAVHTVRTQSKVLYVGKYPIPSFGSFADVCCFQASSVFKM